MTTPPVSQEGTPTVEAIEARLKAATPGPWERMYHADPSKFAPDGSIYGAYGSYGDEGRTHIANCFSDAEFIAHAPADIAFLLAELRRERELRKAAHQAGADEVIDMVDSGEVARDIYERWRVWKGKRDARTTPGYDTLREAIDAARTAHSRNAPFSPSPAAPHPGSSHE